MNDELLTETVEEALPSEAEPLSEPTPDPILSELSALRNELSELRHEIDLRRRADEVNRRNASRSAGRVGTNIAPEYYTPDEVRAMSPSEVRENYQKIRASMKKWSSTKPNF